MSKIIHYCWFGGKELPESAKICIESWKTFFPEYEIKEWNETNYNVRKNTYISEAYDAKKYAFVSDFARFDILFNYGGIYFDTDVEVIKSYDDILCNGSYMGCEVDGSKDGNANRIYVNPGLGMAVEKGNPLLQKIMKIYEKMSFINMDGSMNMKTVVEHTTELLLSNGLTNEYGIQNVGGITIYPAEFFNPKDSRTGKLFITDNTHSIHWYSMTWMSPKQKLRNQLLSPFHRVFGPECFRWLKKFLR